MSALERRRREVLRRRDPAAPPDVDPGQSGSTLDVTFVPSQRADWETWDRMPAEVRDALDDAGCDPDGRFLSRARRPERVRRGGRAMELAEAWAVGDTSLTLLEAVRPAGASGPGSWQLTARRLPFVGEVKSRHGTVPTEAARAVPGRGTGPEPDAEDPDVIDVLPAPVRLQILTTVPEPDFEDDYLVQWYDHDRPYEQEVGLIRVTSRMVIAVEATRRIELGRRQSEREAADALDAAPWYVQACTARLGREEVFHLSTDGAGRSALDSGRRDLPPSGTDRRQIE